MGAPETMQARQAALLLHGLSPAARRQVVDRLDAAEASRLKPLLDELAELGISGSLGQQVHQLAPAAAPEPAPRPLSMKEQAQRLDAEEVAWGLQPCAPVTAAHLLRAGLWPSMTAVLDRTPHARRAEVLRHVHRDLPALAPAVLESLCKSLCLEAAGLSESRGQPVAPTDRRIDGKGWAAVGNDIGATFRSLIKWMR